MTKSPTVAVSTIITDPYSSKYFAYLAFIESWAPFVDEVILVDGNSTDESLEIAKSWVSSSTWAKVRVINTPETYWHPGHQWHALQAINNYYVGMNASSCDWVITINADNILCAESASNMRQMFAQNSDVDAIYFYRGKPSGSGMQRRTDTRSTAINLRRVRETGTPLGFGVEDKGKRGFDFSIIANHKTTFRDPINGTTKRILAGEPYPINRVIDLECAVFGHFFFDLSTAASKMSRWDNAFTRYSGLAYRREAEHRFAAGQYGIVGYRSKDEMMSVEYPQEINRVIDEFYEPNTLGGAIRRVSPMQRRAALAYRKALGIERNLRTRWMRARGYRGLVDYHNWVPLDAQDPEPLDVAEIYSEQDRFLPPELRQTGPRNIANDFGFTAKGRES